MSSGRGRGRGWLNLEKNVQKPGGLQNTFNVDINASHVQKYSKLMHLLEQLDLSDDGILMNHKFKAILNQWKLDCTSSVEVEESFKYIYAQCRKKSSLGKNVVNMVSSYSFKTVTINEVTIRKVFIQLIQNDFENRIIMQQLYPNEFRNSLCMLGEFYHKARLSYGLSFQFLVEPTLQYLDMLLDSASQTDIELFTSQLYLNGASLKEIQSEKVDKLLMRVRQLLLESNALTSTSRAWLLLALDVAYNRFVWLPPELCKFYQEKLGDAAMVNIQGTHSMLSIETSHSDKILENCTSTVNILKISPPDLALSIKEQENNINNLQKPSDKNLKNQETVEPAVNYNIREKMGRPILGVGARLQKDHDLANWKESRKTNFNNWDKGKNEEVCNTSSWREQGSWNTKRDKPSHTGENEGGNPYRNIAKHSKGWEHDDRFDTDYD